MTSWAKKCRSSSTSVITARSMRPSRMAMVDTNRSHVDGRGGTVLDQAAWMARASGWPMYMRRLRKGNSSSSSTTSPASTPLPAGTAVLTSLSLSLPRSASTRATLASGGGGAPPEPLRPGDDQAGHLPGPCRSQGQRHLPQRAALGEDVVHDQDPGTAHRLRVGHGQRRPEPTGGQRLAGAPVGPAHRRGLTRLADQVPPD